MTVDEYLDWASSTGLEGRYELVDGRVVEMAAERAIHAITKGEVFAALREAIRIAGVDHTAIVDGLTVTIASMTGRVPDVLVVPGRPGDETMKAESPIIVVEVISPGSIKVDRETKLAEYASVGSIEHYLIVDASARAVTHHRRTDDGFSEKTLTDGTLELTPPGLSVTNEDLLPPIG
ncbi:MAG: Uma2 family endonuclease [Pseudomonadota bacterium]